MLAGDPVAFSGAHTSDRELGMSSGARFASSGKELVATKPTLVLSMPQNYIIIIYKPLLAGSPHVSMAHNELDREQAKHDKVQL